MDAVTPSARSIPRRPAAPLPPAPGFVKSAFRIFDLSLSEMLWSRRTIFMGLLVGAPVLFALLVRGLVFLGAPIFEDSPDARRRAHPDPRARPVVFGHVIWLLYLRVIVPILGVFYGTSLMADEVEDKTITYLFSRPIRRGAVLLGKYLAYVVCTVFVVLPSVMIVYLLIVPINGIARRLVHRPAQGSGAAVAGAGGLWGGVRVHRGEAEAAAPGGADVHLRLGTGGDGLPRLHEEVHGRLLPPGPGPPRHAERRRDQRPPGPVPGDPGPGRQPVLARRSSGLRSWRSAPGWSSAGNMCWSSRERRRQSSHPISATLNRSSEGYGDEAWPSVRWASRPAELACAVAREASGSRAKVGTFYRPDLYNLSRLALSI